MHGAHSIRQLAVLAVSLLLQSQLALALPQGNEIAEPAPSVWITVDPQGVGVPITPVVMTNNGAKTTSNAPPESLLATGTYTLSPGGRPTTYTGLPPVATATGKSSSLAGAVLACTKYQDVDIFCQPRAGTVMYPGEKYYGKPAFLSPLHPQCPPAAPLLRLRRLLTLCPVTWSSMHFGNADRAQVELQGTFPNSPQGISTGFRVPANQGFFAWWIPDKILETHGVDAINMTLQLAEFDLDTEEDNDHEPVIGPTVLIVRGPPPAQNSGSGGGTGKSVPVVAIAVPVVIAVVLLILGTFCVWSWKRHGTVPLVGAALGKGKRSSQGYGVRQSRSDRVGGGGGAGGGAAGFDLGSSDKQGGANVGIQLTDRESWSPTGTGSRNVFREELERQQRQG